MPPIRNGRRSASSQRNRTVVNNNNSNIFTTCGCVRFCGHETMLVRVRSRTSSSYNFGQGLITGTVNSSLAGLLVHPIAISLQDINETSIVITNMMPHERNLASHFPVAILNILGLYTMDDEIYEEAVSDDAERPESRSLLEGAVCSLSQEDDETISLTDGEYEEVNSEVFENERNRTYSPINRGSDEFQSLSPPPPYEDVVGGENGHSPPPPYDACMTLVRSPYLNDEDPSIL